MDTHYSIIEEKVHMEYIQEKHRNRIAQIFIEGFDKLGMQWEPLRSGQSNCGTDERNDCIVYNI